MGEQELDEDQARKCVQIAQEAVATEDFDKALRFLERALRFDPKNATAKQLKQSLPPKAKIYTPDQEALSKKVLKAKDLYAVLQLSDRGATEAQIKKAYRQLAMQLHPDKNAAPSAEEAFKRVSKAFQILSDKTSRSDYDQTGQEDPANNRATRSYASHGEAQFMTPEDLFQAFFGFGPGTTYRTRQVYTSTRAPRAAE